MAREMSEDTRLLYCTTGVLLQKLINDKNMHRFTHVILDEVKICFCYSTGLNWQQLSLNHHSQVFKSVPCKFL